LISQLHDWGVKAEEQQAVQVLRTAVSTVDRLKLAVVTILLAPVAEEMLFRGLLYAWIRQIGFPRLALVLTAGIFAFVHFNLATFLPLFVLAVILAVLYERTGNLLAPIAAHSTFNALNFLLLLWMQSRPV
jgi:membrane protease YdiL (CAAX protease family)